MKIDPALCVRFSLALPCREHSPAVLTACSTQAYRVLPTMPEMAREHRECLCTDSPAVSWPWSRASQEGYSAAPTKFEAEWATSETHRLVALDDP